MCIPISVFFKLCLSDLDLNESCKHTTLMIESFHQSLNSVARDEMPIQIFPILFKGK